MAQALCILGRQPSLGIAELESLLGAQSLKPVGNNMLLVDKAPSEIPFHRLGGTIKLAKLLTILDTTNWNEIEQFLINSVVPHADHLPEGKMNLGLSVYDLSVKPSRINATGLELKKIIKQHGRPVRVIPNKTPELSSAQVLHNDLTGPKSWELLFIKHGSQTYVAQTTNSQDINAYAARDQRRPKRDARVGMLPPKLAQIIINLAGSHTLSTTGLPPTKEETARSKTVHSGLSQLLDPFCGTGVILQEALLMGYDVYGTDIESRMIDYCKENLDWLAARQDLGGLTYLLETGDATSFDWQSFDLIACETYLGRPFSAEPKSEILNEVIKDVDTIHKKFLQNVAKQTESGFRMCIAVPAWKVDNSFKRLPILDHLEKMGYTRTSFVHAKTEDLIYHREDQIVGRELVTLKRK